MNLRFKAILVGGLVGGTFDIAYATIFSNLRSGVPPTRILQSVAAGLLGTKAFEGGTATAALGLALHFAMVLIIAAIYVSAVRSMDVLVRRPLLYGTVYGLVVYAVMNAVVLPLSNLPPRSSAPPLILVTTGLLVHVFGVGVPIAFAARKYMTK